ncbi:MAG TPA: class I SAM-dependent methyltransferase [Methylomirabilota bacterium]|nr:class I SAM-dependent methyltransferase [Methylomirabilota bacterium]
MSRLDSFIRRMQAQRACLDHAAELIRDLPGPVLELGLGNGRTYDHLCQRLPERTIFAFDRQLAAHPASIPPPGHLLLGEIGDTLPAMYARIGATAALVHIDIGSGDAAANARLAAFISPQVERLVAPGGVVLSDQALIVSRLQPADLPAGVSPGRYHLYRAP